MYLPTLYLYDIYKCIHIQLEFLIKHLQKTKNDQLEKLAYKFSFNNTFIKYNIIKTMQKVFLSGSVLIHYMCFKVTSFIP